MKQYPWNKWRHLFSPSSKKNQLLIDDDTIWQASAHFNMPGPPDALESWRNLQTQLNRHEIAAGPSRSQIAWFPRPRLALVFTIMLLTTISLLWIIPVFHGERYSTVYAQFKTVMLPDSSQVTLNCGSQLIVDRQFNQVTRTVRLNGEAFFNVRKGTLPFIVETTIGDVRVTGTSFNVKIRDDRLDVGVASGIVLVSAQDSTVELTKGFQTVCMNHDVPAVPTKIANSLFPDWQHNRFYFENTSITAVCHEIERRFAIHIELSDASLSAIFISGLLEADNPLSAMISLCALIQKEYRHEDDAFIIY
ncbi:FecR domain-containing protein [candidate division KSB1 bacterium]|nr:FecR domain-containing protein [candidate division KSB1 bacterium]